MKRFFKKKDKKDKKKEDAAEDDAGEDVTVRISNSNIAPLQLRGLFPEKIRGKVFEIGEEGGTIGSLPESTIQIQDSQRSVSRTHCRILYSSSDGSYHIADLNSSNSTSLTTDKSTFKLSPQTYFALKSGFIIHIGVEVQLIVAEDKNAPQQPPANPYYMDGGGMQPGPGGVMQPGPGGNGSMSANMNSQYGSPMGGPGQYGMGYGAPPPGGGYGAGGGMDEFDQPPMHQSVVTDFSAPSAMQYQASYTEYGGQNQVDAELEATLAALSIPSDDFAGGSMSGGGMGSTMGGDPFMSIGGGGAKVKVYFVKLDSSKPVMRMQLTKYVSTSEVIQGVYELFGQVSGRITYTDGDGDEIEISPSTDFDDITNYTKSVQLYEG